MPLHIHEDHEHKVYFIDPINGDDNTESGSVYNPYRTIQAALDDLRPIIELTYGTYSESLTIPSGYGSNCPLIQSNNIDTDQETTITGTMTIPSGVAGLKCYGIKFDGNSQTCIIDNGSDGGHYFDNCTFSNSGSNDCITINNGRNAITIEGSIIDGDVNLSGTGVNSKVFIKSGINSHNCNISVNSGYDLEISYIEKMGLISHSGGNIVCSNILSWEPDTNGYIINSSANTPSTITVLYSNLTDDGVTYGTINRTGTATLKTSYNVES